MPLRRHHFGCFHSSTGHRSSRRYSIRSCQFATSFTTIRAEDIRQQVEAIYAQQRYWPEPLIQINPSYKRSTSVDGLAAAGTLHSECSAIFRTGRLETGQPLSLYKHQEQAIALAADGESYVVTTGTGAGKSLCFFIPIISDVLAERRAGVPQRTKAIIIYPMNALANSQLEEIDKFTSNVAGSTPSTKWRTNTVGHQRIRSTGTLMKNRRRRRPG